MDASEIVVTEALIPQPPVQRVMSFVNEHPLLSVLGVFGVFYTLHRIFGEQHGS